MLSSRQVVLQMDRGLCLENMMRRASNTAQLSRKTSPQSFGMVPQSFCMVPAVHRKKSTPTPDVHQTLYPLP